MMKMSVTMLKTKCLFVTEEMVLKLMKKEALNVRLWLQEGSLSQVSCIVQLVEVLRVERSVLHVVTDV